ncbi:MAG: tetraacyldisaccharide 4'-kinase [Acidaminococcaceae bacterium]|nr:tetraacyldisaccharide 4'-kinase [Acidaminococcaceae bacterium]
MYILYNILGLLAFFVLILPFSIYRLVTEKGFSTRFRQSIGLIRREEIANVVNTDCIWIHGASVGEIVATSPIVKEIKKTMPERKVLVSAFTVPGYNMAKQIIPEADAIIYFPLDLAWVAESVVRRVHPGIFMPVETELWPNFLRALRERNIPVMMVNGRISERSVKTYQYLFSIWRDMLRTVSRFCMQSSIDANYITHLGADPQKIFVTGNTKFDQTYAEVTPEDLANYKMELGLDKDAFPVILAGSTHAPEEKYLLTAFSELHKKYPRARLIMALRFNNRVDEIKRLCDKYGYKAGLRSKLKNMNGPRPEYPVVLIDTIGELGRIYSVGDIVFIGGSLMNHGGHNVLEPAAHAKPIVVGPSMQNFKDSYSLLSKAGALRTVQDTGGLTKAFLEIAGDDALRRKMGEASLQVIRENRGAALNTMHYLTDLLQKASVPHAYTKEYPVNTRNFNDAGGGGLKHGAAIIQYIFHMAHAPERPWYAFILLGFLRGLSYLYGFGARVNLWMYEAGLLTRRKLDCCVISIGNITVGGTGKTPTAQRVAEMIKNLGYRVVILNRGYRSHWDKPLGVVSDGKKIYMTSYEAGDEAYLMAKMMPGVPVVIGKNRDVTGRYAVEELHAEVIIMDDGYQHWQLNRDLDIVLVDTLNLFGNGNLLPRGILREPLSHLNRADLFLFTKSDQSSQLTRTSLAENIRQYNTKAPIVESIHHAKEFVEIADWYKGIQQNALPLKELQGKRVMVFSAIGNPSSFEQNVSGCGLEIVEAIRYPDHHDYGMLEMQYIGERANELKADALITTGKDAVKIPTEFIYFNREIPLYVMNMDIMVTRNGETFDRKLADTVREVVSQNKRKGSQQNEGIRSAKPVQNA